jgi:glycosyltransferase involved in cell wall biosynthesis
MYCGLCIRDNALVKILRQMGHQVIMVPLYLPFTLDEADQSEGTPIFFSGINVYLEQNSALFRSAPQWFHNLFTSRALLKKVAGKATGTRPEELGDLTLSMLRGEEGRQARELDQLIAWLKTQPKPDVICLSTTLLIGLARRLQTELKCPVVCMFQGEDYFLDALPEPARTDCWKTVAQRGKEVALFVAPTRTYGELMRSKLGLPPEKLRVVFNGISLDDYKTPNGLASTHSLGYFARMCKEKGLDTLVEAFILIRQRGRVNDLKLKIGGGCGPGDEPFVKGLRERLSTAGLSADVEFQPNLDRKAKVEFLKSLTVFSVPALYGEAFGLYLIEAMAAGVPAVQPRSGAFPELIETSGGGVICEAGNAKALADAVEDLLVHPERARALGESGRKAVQEKFSAEAMARETVRVFEDVRSVRSLNR